MGTSNTPSPDIQMVPLTEGGLELEMSEMECLSVRTLLEANGIEVIVQGASQMPNLPYEILVPASQLEAAVRIVTEARADGAAAVDESSAG